MLADHARGPSEGQIAQMRKNLVKAIQEVGSLTHQQRQLLDQNEFRPLFDEIRWKRRWKDVAIALVAVGLFYGSISALISGREMSLIERRLVHGLPYGVAVILVRRILQLQHASQCLTEFYDVPHLPQPASSELLQVELLSCHRLEFRDRQSLKAGDIVGAARPVSQRSADSLSGKLLAGVGIFCLLPVFLNTPPRISDIQIHVVVNYLVTVVVGTLFIWCGISLIRRRRRNSERLVDLLRQVEREVSGSQIIAVTDSPTAANQITAKAG